MQDGGGGGVTSLNGRGDYLSCTNAAVQYSFNKKQMREGDQEIKIEK